MKWAYPRGNIHVSILLQKDMQEETKTTDSVAAHGDPTHTVSLG